MNNTITLSQVITRLAKITDTDTNTARLFVRSFFAAVEESLMAGESVSIKGIGTFMRNSDSAFGGDSPVLFRPDAALAEEVNAPFSMFEAVELADGLDFPEESPVEPVEEKSEQAEEDTVEEAPAEKVEEIAEEPAGSDMSDMSDMSDSSDQSDSSEQPAAAPTPEPTPEPTPKKRSIPLWPGVALAIVAGSVSGYFAAVYEPEEPEAQEILMPADSIAEPVIEEVSVEELSGGIIPADDSPAPEPIVQEPEPEPTPAPRATEPKYDTVTSSRYLATMAREYYGKGIYWVFIYQANTDILDNPNKIKPGTRVKIPEKSSFAEDSEAATQRKAERIQSELFKKYK
ncbi:MAG: hypothetical protein NC418_00630 [Muribaculaceae bacterium]|nr:hypothetical protein [Muribaculaceae bacterium]